MKTLENWDALSALVHLVSRVTMNGVMQPSFLVQRPCYRYLFKCT